MSVRDTRLEERALVQRWPVKPEYREAMIRRLVRVIADPSSSPREVSAASRAILAAEGQNQQDEHKVIDVRVSTRHDQLDAIAADLGIDVSAIEDATRATDRSAGSIAGEVA